MQTLRRAFLTTLAWALLASLAFGQYSPDQLRDLQPTVLAIGESVRAANPVAWRNAHNAGEPQGSEFVRRWAMALRAQGVTACVNGKRGSDTLSQDVLVFPVTANGNTDTSGQYGQIAIIDVIGGAGGPSPSLGWNDVSAASPGKCIVPTLGSGEGGSSTTPPVVTPPTTQPQPQPQPAPVDLSPITAALARIEARLDTLERLAADGDPALLKAFVDDMVGQGPGGDPDVTPNHVTDIKERLDLIRANLDALSKWLRSRRALGF